MLVWDERFKSTVRSLRAEGVTWDDIATRFSARPENMRVNASKFGLVSRRQRPWTSGMDERLFKGILAGQTFREVAADIGVTRNAAIGRWYRIRRMV